MAMKTTFLFGAGVSVSAGVPTAIKMTEQMLANITSRKRKDRVADVLKYVIGGLMFQNSTKGGDPYAGVNIEDLFNSIAMLGNRRELEAAPFIGSWHYKVDEFDTEMPSIDDYQPIYDAIVYQMMHDIKDAMKNARIDHCSGDKIDQALSGLINKERYYGVAKSIGTEIEKMVNQLPSSIDKNLSTKPKVAFNNFNISMNNVIRDATGKRKGKLFEDAMKVMVRELKHLVWISDADKTAYLDPLLMWCKSGNCASIASLNYDNGIESSAKRLGVRIHNGLECIQENGEFGHQPGSVSLIKLHGSINWTYKRREDGSISQEVIENEDDKFADEQYDPALIFGQKNKLTAKGPFLDLYRAYRDSLNESANLVVSGYSFADSHINESILKWLNRSTAGKLIILDPNVDKLRRDYRGFVHQLMTHPKKDNIEFIQGYFAEGILECLNKV